MIWGEFLLGILGMEGKGEERIGLLMDDLDG